MRNVQQLHNTITVALAAAGAKHEGDHSVARGLDFVAIARSAMTDWTDDELQLYHMHTHMEIATVKGAPPFIHLLDPDLLRHGQSMVQVHTVVCMVEDEREQGYPLTEDQVRAAYRQEALMAAGLVGDPEYEEFEYSAHVLSDLVFGHDRTNLREYTYARSDRLGIPKEEQAELHYAILREQNVGLSWIPEGRGFMYLNKERDLEAEARLMRVSGGARPAAVPSTTTLPPASSEIVDKVLGAIFNEELDPNASGITFIPSPTRRKQLPPDVQ